MEILDYSEKWGKDVEEAVKLALIDLKCSREDVNVIVLEEPSKGFFGIGARLAKVRVEHIKKEAPAEEKPEKAEKKEPAPVSHAVQMSKDNDFRNKGKRTNLPKKEAKPETKTEEPVVKPYLGSVEAPGEAAQAGASEPAKAPVKKEAPAKSAEKKEKAEKKAPAISKFSVVENEEDAVAVTDGPAIEFLKNMIEKMGLNLDVRAFEKDSVLYVSIEGKDTGTVIGKRGQTLDAIQYLTSLVANKDRDKYLRVIVNAENYREKREVTLQKLALRLADSVARSRKSVKLEPMNPYERKVIHSTLQNSSKVTTRSEGEEPRRRVIIELKKREG